jgi:hypothetical protein
MTNTAVILYVRDARTNLQLGPAAKVRAGYLREVRFCGHNHAQRSANAAPDHSPREVLIVVEGQMRR